MLRLPRTIFFNDQPCSWKYYKNRCHLPYRWANYPRCPWISLIRSINIVISDNKNFEIDFTSCSSWYHILVFDFFSFLTCIFSPSPMNKSFWIKKIVQDHRTYRLDIGKFFHRTRFHYLLDTCHKEVFLVKQ